MIRHVVCYPSADPRIGLDCAAKWMAKGYDVEMHVDPGASVPALIDHDPHRVISVLELPQPFRGYYREINGIVHHAFTECGADLVTCIGDDMDPPEQGAAWVADRYLSRFPDGFGVMQGTGDKTGEIMKDTVTGTYQHNAGRICGSPTFGRGWARRAYGGRGPFCEDYISFYGDEDLQHVAHLSGVLFQEPEITILHRHWAFGKMRKMPYHETAGKNWNADKATFNRRYKAGFPGWEPKQ